MLDRSLPVVTPAEATTYVTDRGLTGWPAGATQQAQAILRGQGWVSDTYNLRWTESFTNATAPDLVKQAVIEAALIEARNPGALTAKVSIASQAKVLNRVGTLGWHVPDRRAWDSDTVQAPHIDAMLSSLVTPAVFTGITVV